jgi:hypothetical protein
MRKQAWRVLGLLALDRSCVRRTTLAAGDELERAGVCGRRRRLVRVNI